MVNSNQSGEGKVKWHLKRQTDIMRRIHEGGE